VILPRAGFGTMRRCSSSEGRKLVLTHDMIVEGVHFLAADPPEDVAWKLVAVNLSDLAAKGARPIGALVGYCLSPAADWNDAFVRGLGSALTAFDLALLGGDTVSAPPGAPRAFGLTAIGEAESAAPSRAGARPGDLLWVSGTIGDAARGSGSRSGSSKDRRRSSAAIAAPSRGWNSASALRLSSTR
jgi:thiamine-monophosphate kinase